MSGSLDNLPRYVSFRGRSVDEPPHVEGREHAVLIILRDVSALDSLKFGFRSRDGS